VSAARRAPLRVVVQKICRARGVPSAAAIRTWIGKALAGVLSGEVTVRVIGEAESAALNEEYRGKRGATNVLAFLAAPAMGGEHELADGDTLPAGDIAICAPVLEREAAEQGKPLAAHWAHIVIHGALHLAGFDHETRAEARVMEARERELLAGFGIADPYAAPPAERAPVACKPPGRAAR
jgi:probable rRNA maturation factor